MVPARSPKVMPSSTTRPSIWWNTGEGPADGLAGAAAERRPAGLDELGDRGLVGRHGLTGRGPLLGYQVLDALVGAGGRRALAEEGALEFFKVGRGLHLVDLVFGPGQL